jgi:hypothetical protein
MTRLKLAVVGTLAGNPYSGMAWMIMQICAGFHRLGHDVRYFEFTSEWPYDPVRQMKVGDALYAVPYLARLAERFGLGDRWAYRQSFADGSWFGMSRSAAEEFLASADAAFNIAGATRLAKEQLRVRNWTHYGTDPVIHEIRYANGDPIARTLVDEHQASVTYGENIGTSHSPVPPLPHLKARTRQPVLLDLWQAEAPARHGFSTVANWKQVGLDLPFGSETYLWSKHHEFLKFVDLPQRAALPIELVMNLARRQPIRDHDNESVPAIGVEDDRSTLEGHGWQLTDASFTSDPWRYNTYVKSCRAEFTVARDLHVRTRSGWFSERSACYLAAGRPVVTQDTGFGTTLPTGCGLFAFDTMDDILGAFDAVNSDYERHSRAARDIAHEYFSADRVLPKLLQDLGY